MQLLADPSKTGCSPVKITAVQPSLCEVLCFWLERTVQIHVLSGPEVGWLHA